MTKKIKSVNDYIKEYFEAHLKQDIEHDKVVDYVFKFIPKARDPWRAIRMLYQKGWLIQVKKGVYRRDPNYRGQDVTAPFPNNIREQIFKRDNYRCVVCGNGKHNGYEIHADHIKPQAKGGNSTLENGQTLCSEHNLMKKRYGVIEFLGKYCRNMIDRAKQYKDTITEKMFKEILDVLKKYKLD